MIINTPSTKILPEMDVLIAEICREVNCRRSQFFIRAVLKATRIPYKGLEGIKKLDFGNSKDRNHKPRFHTIGSRVNPELKVEVKKICKKHSISESQFYRWALEMEILFYQQKRSTRVKAQKQTELQIPLPSKQRTALQGIIASHQKMVIENYRIAHQVGNIAGLIVLFLSQIGNK